MKYIQIITWDVHASIAQDTAQNKKNDVQIISKKKFSYGEINE